MTRADGGRVAASAGFLLLTWTLAGGSAMLQPLRDLDPTWLAAAVALTVPMQLLSALRWQFTCARIGAPLRHRDAVAGYYLASLLNMVLPGGVAGDVVRGWRHGRGEDGGPSRYRSAAHGIILERSAGQVALLALLLIGAACNPPELHALGAASATKWIAALALAGTLIAAVALVAALRHRPLAGALLADARRAFTPLPVLLVQGTLSLAVSGCYLAIFWVTARALGAPLDAALALLAVPLVLAAMALPVSVGGTGPRELSAATLWPLFGMSAAEGAATALAYGVVILLGSLPGIVVLLRGQRATRRR